MANSFVNDTNEISASKIYNFLQTNRITNEIFLEILSEIKDKNGYKQLKKMIMDLISTHKNALYNPATERSKRASIINEICMIAFTIDTVFPSVLRMKVQQEFPKLISDILYELKDEQKIDHFVPYPEPQSSVSTVNENAAKTSVATVNTSSPNSDSSKMSYEEITKGSALRCIASSLNPDAKATSSKSPSPIINTSVKSSPKKDNVPVRKKAKIQKGQKTDVEIVSNDSTVADAVQSVPNNLKEVKVVPNVKKPEKETENASKVDKDAESDILSLLSVSSVHTSELSSFDDAISLSSDYEDNGKKKIKLDDLKEMYQNDRISEWCAENFQSSKSRRSSVGTEESTIAEKRELVKDANKVSSPEVSPTSASLFWTSTPQKVLPPRIRKPNSKYISDDILNPAVLRQHKKEIYSDLQTITTESPLSSPRKRKRMKSGSSSEDKETDLINKNQRVASKEENVVNNMKSANRSSSTNACKPFTSVQPLTSRRATAPVTLFSTYGQR